MKYKVAANVRQDGAIGVFYRQVFDIDTVENWKARWFKPHSD